MLKTFSRFLTTTASADCMAVSELQKAIAAIGKFSIQEATSTIGYWDSDEEATRAVADIYLAALKAIEQKGSNTYLIEIIDLVPNPGHYKDSKIYISARQVDFTRSFVALHS